MLMKIINAIIEFIISIVGSEKEPYTEEEVDMPKFSSKSKEKLNTCDENLQKVFNEVIKHFDCTIVCGHRSVDEQMELFKQGRKFENSKWVIDDIKKVVTNIDGKNQLSMHNPMPSQAVDVAPYPIDWNNTKRFYYFAGYVMATAKQMGINIRCGADWDSDTDLDDQTLVDLPHFEII